MNKLLRNVAEFHERFGLIYEGLPSELTPEQVNFAHTAFKEEIDEWFHAVASGDVEGQLDAYIDLIYFVLGRVYLQGFNFDEAWNRVHDANMKKVRALNASDSKRNSKLDVIKPEGWVAPSFDDLMEIKSKFHRRPRFFIVEGPDACGKTTFSKLLAKRFDAVYWHMTGTKKLFPAMEDYTINALENVRDNLEQGRDVVLDRCWISELCYGAHFRGVEYAQLMNVAEMCDSMDPIHIFCMDPGGSEAAADRHEVHLDSAHPYKREDFIVVYENYEKLLNLPTLFKETPLVKEFNPNLSPEESFAQFVNTQLADYFYTKPHES